MAGTNVLAALTEPAQVPAVGIVKGPATGGTARSRLAGTPLAPGTIAFAAPRFHLAGPALLFIRSSRHTHPLVLTQAKRAPRTVHARLLRLSAEGATGFQGSIPALTFAGALPQAIRVSAISQIVSVVVLGIGALGRCVFLTK